MSEERTTFIGGMWVQGMADSAPEVAPEPTADGFASPWHRRRYVEDLRRELAEIEQKLAAVGPPKWMRAQHESHEAAVRAEIERLSE
jgi:hypothetical protein